MKEKRRSSGLTQKQLAQRAGITQATVSRIESGAAPSLWAALLIARALDVHAEELFTLEQEELPATLQRDERR